MSSRSSSRQRSLVLKDLSLSCFCTDFITFSTSSSFEMGWPAPALASAPSSSMASPTSALRPCDWRMRSLKAENTSILTISSLSRKRDMSCVGKAETVYGNIDIVWGSTFADFSALCYPRAPAPCAGLNPCMTHTSNRADRRG